MGRRVVDKKVSSSLSQVAAGINTSTTQNNPNAAKSSLTYTLSSGAGTIGHGGGGGRPPAPMASNRISLEKNVPELVKTEKPAPGELISKNGVAY